MRKDWEVKKLGNIATYVNGYAFKPNQWSDIGLPIIRIQNLNDNDAQYNYCNNDNIPSKYLVNKGDILISWSASLGVYEWLKNTAYLNQHIFKVVFDKLEINKYYFKYAVSSKIDHMVRNAHGATMKHIVKKDFDNTPIYYPPLQIQQQIVEELDCLTSIIEKQKKQLEELDNLAQAIFYDMFGEPMENEKGWNIKKLEDIVHKNCTLSYGIVQPMEDVVDGVPIVRPIDLIDTFVSDTSLKRTRKEISNKYKRTILTGHEILLCVRGTTGIVSLVNESFAGYNVTRGIVPILLSSLYNRWFVYYQIKTSSIQQKISELTYGIALRQINIKDLRALTLITPPLSLQQQFASKIEAIEKQKELIKKSIKETEDLFNSRIDYYFN